MTNNDTITFNSSTHGTFKVSADHLAGVANGHSGWALDGLIHKVEGLAGGHLFDYSDLRWLEALILISYLTGGSAD